ncbi:MAG: carbohydrate ABC transporter substrate-binding protein [Burkholderiales bacterium]|nr:carbohydrate ABC transporter substrate-binding protein [Burkholderiales bacterium]
MKRREALTAGLASAAALAAAPRWAAGAPAVGSGPVTLRFTWWGGSDRHNRTLKAIAAFEARNPDIRIKPEYLGMNGYLEKLTTQMVGGTEPDVMQINWAWLSMFSRQGTGFADLNPLRGALALDQFAADDLRICTVRDKLNGLPVSYTARIFLWNTAAFARAGVPVPKTWEELYAAGPAFLARKGERAYPLDGELYDMLLLTQARIFQQHGMPFVHPTEPRVAMSREAVREWVHLYKRVCDEHVATPLPYRASLGGAEKPTEQQQDWVVGNWAGNYTWDTAIRLRQSTLDKQQQLDIGDFLTVPGASNSGMFGRPTMLFSVSKHSKAPEAAARFVNYLLTDPQAARILSITRGVPSASGALAALVADKALPPLEYKAYLQIKQQRDAGRIDRPSPRFEDARFRRFLREVFETVAYGKTSVDEAAQRLFTDGNAWLARIK